MAEEILIAIDIGDPQLARQILDEVKTLEKVNGTELPSAATGRKLHEAGPPPDILVIDDHPAGEGLFRRLDVFRQSFPKTAIFVVSSDTRPQRIVEVMKAGASEYLLLPLDKQLLDHAVGEVRARLVDAGRLGGGEIYSFISSKGGLGATVIAVNFAVALLQKEKTGAALIDLSLQSGDASVLLDLVPTTTIRDISRNFSRLDNSFLRGAMSRHKSGLDFLAAPLDPEDSREVGGEHIARILTLARKLYDRVVVDCTSMFTNEGNVEAFQASEKVFVVTDLSIPAVRNAARLLRLLEKAELPADQVEVVVNRYIKGSALSLDEAESTMGRRAYWLFPNDFNNVVSSINEGVPLVKAKTGAPFARSLTDFVEKLIAPQADVDYRGIRGTFGRAI